MAAAENLPYMHRPAAAVAERILSRNFGSKVRLGPEEPLNAGVDLKANVRRCRVEEGPVSCGASIILKRIIGSGPYEPSDVRPSGGSYGLPTMAWRLLAEWATTRFVSDLAPDSPPTPRCWGGDLEEGVVVLEDLGPEKSLRHLLYSNDPRCAQEGLLDYARTLGRIHALTVGREAEYQQLWRELGRGATLGRPREREARSLQEDLRRFRQFADQIGIADPPGLEEELARLATWLADPGPFLALGHVENQPINTHVGSGGVRLLDFEYSRYFPCVMDGMFLHVYPWVSHRVPNEPKSQMETVYRQALARGCPEAGDDRAFGQAYTASRAVWTVRTVLFHLSGDAMERDSAFEDHGVHVEGESIAASSTNRQRIMLLLENFAAEAAARGRLPAFGALAENAVSRLRARWRPDPYLIPVYPALGEQEEPEPTRVADPSGHQGQ